MIAVHQFQIKACIFNILYLNIISAANDCYYANSCAITCTGNYNKNWAEEIKQIAENKNCTTLERMDVLNSRFTPKILQSDWLKPIANVLEIKLLKFTSCDFESIEPEALNIKGLLNLHFSDGAVSYFKREFFNDMKELTTFNLDNFIDDLHAEQCLFKNAPRLDTLSIEKCVFDGQLIGNITGQDGCPTQLQNIVIQFNKLEYLPPFVVSNASDLRSFYLQKNGLLKVSKQAFWHVNIQKIDLRGNNFKTLQNGTFDPIKNQQCANRTLILSDIDFKCDCDLQWLQELYFSPEIVTIDPEPKCDNSQFLSAATFECDVDKTTISASTLSTSTASTNPVQTITLDCMDADKNAVPDASISTREFLRSYVITIEAGNNKLVRVDVYELELDENDETPQLELTFTDMLIDTSLLYFEIFDSESPSCIANIDKSVFLNKLERNHTYTFCLLAKDETTVPPTNCFGLQIPPNWENRSWITNENKVLVIASMAFAFLLCAATSGIIAYYVIKTYPRLIAGNKDVIILKHGPKIQKPPEAPKFERPDYAEPTHCYNEPRSGYMTPAGGNYEKINYYTRRTNSIYGGRSNSYIRPGFNGAGCSNRIDEVEKMETYTFTVPPPLPKLNTTQDKLYY